MTAPATLIPDHSLNSLEHIPLFQEAGRDEELASLADSDPLAFHLRAYRAVGPIYRAKVKGKIAVYLSGLESNEFIWKSISLWTYRNTKVAFREQLGEDHVTAIDGPQHREKRTILKPAFDQAPAMRYLPQYNSIFHDRLVEGAASGELDMVNWWARTICYTQSRTVARCEISEELLENLVAWEKTLLSGIALGEERKAYYERENYLRLKKIALDFIGKLVDARLAEPQKYDDNFSAVMQSRLEVEGADVNHESLVDDLYFVLLAGVENTSKLISAALFGILRNPDWLKELREELAPWDGQDVMALSRMSRLKATVMETQRLYPSIMLNPREAVEDFTFAGHTVPKGTVVMHVQTLCHYLEDFYADPLEFKPQRFVEDGRFAAKTMGIFGGGTHLCLGRNHTLLQTPIALAHLLKYYDMEIVEETASGNGTPFLPGKFLEKLSIRLTPRES